MNEKYNILILNHHAGSPDLGGGGRHFELAKDLSERGYRVAVLASSYNSTKGEYFSEDEVMKKKFNDNFEFIRLKTNPPYSDNITRFRNYYDYMKKATKFEDFGFKPDIVIGSSVHPFTWPAAFDISKKYGAKFIVEVRDLWPLSMYEDFSGLMRKGVFAFFERLEKKYYKLADAIITTAPFAYEYMEEKYNIDKNKVFYIPHGIDLDKFDKQKEGELSLLESKLEDILKNNFSVTYTGSFSSSEGLPSFVEAAKDLKDLDLKLVIVGSGPDYEEMVKIKEKYSLDKVHMFSRQDRDMIPLILKNSDILICGLKERKAFYYGISKNKFYDYMAAQKPIIFASNVRASLIEKSKSGMTIEPDNPEIISRAIRKVYNNINSLGEEYGKNGRKYVEENHTNKKITDQFLQVIDFVEKN